jgi:integrase
MSVRKRTWSVRGEPREAWIADYVDQGGERHIKTFAKRSDAVAFHANVNVEVTQGRHTADRRSPTIAEAGELWLKSGAGLQRTTLNAYRQHLHLHINPMLGNCAAVAVDRANGTRVRGSARHLSLVSDGASGAGLARQHRR